MTGSMRQWRAYQLVSTAGIVIRHQGFAAFAGRLLRWLHGERRYFRGKLTAKTYRQFQHVFEPSEGALECQRTVARQWDVGPTFGLVTAVYNPDPDIFRETLESIQAQTYERWHWYVVDASDDDRVWHFLAERAANDHRIRPQRLQTNLGIAANTNVALDAVQDDYIVMVDHDDTLAPFALFEVAQVIRDHPEAEFIYSDADKLDERGERCEPLFKPDWSPEALLSFNLLSQLSVYRRDWIERVGGLNPELDGAQDWDLYLRIIEHTQNVYHIPMILYHWRKTPASTAQHASNKHAITEVQAKALRAHLQRTGLHAPDIQFLDKHPIHKMFPLVTWELTAIPKISIIIPSRDHADLLAACLNSIFTLTTYPDYQVVLVDTGSVEAATHDLYRRYTNDERFALIRYTETFNFSKACNAGARRANGELLLFLNNDTKVLQGDWLLRLAQWFERPGVGIVGAKLLYPGRRIQHAGVIVGMGGLASHIFGGEQENSWSIFGSDGWYRNYLAVTAACLMIPRHIFDEVDGFDETFSLNYSDVDLGLKVQQASYRVVYTPHVRLLHYESATHGARIPRADFDRAAQKWRGWLESGDPYFNPNLTYRRSTPAVRLSADDVPVQINREVLQRLPDAPYVSVPYDLV